MYTGAAHTGGATCWVCGTAHRAAMPDFIIKSLKLSKLLKSSSLQVSQALFLASEKVFLKHLWWFSVKKLKPYFLAISQKMIA